MLHFLISIFGFSCLFVSDVFQISGKKCFVALFSLPGYLGIFSAILLLSLKYPVFPVPGYLLLIKIIIIVFFAAAFFYILFIEIPFSSQYRQNGERTVIDFGSYGMVRHPGFISFILLIASLNYLYLRVEYLLGSILMIILDLVLILLEDIRLFPKLFTGYADYKNRVPFLFPRIKQRCKDGNADAGN